jgi:hypothetical protein
MRPRFPIAVAALALLSSVAWQTPTTITAPRTTGPSHIVVIVMENHEYSAIMGAGSDATYLRSMAASSVSLSRLFAITHPSLPNYLALTSGSTQGVTSDCTSCIVDAPNIADQLDGAGITWKAYMESIPSACYTGVGNGSYYMKHDPFMYCTDIRSDPARCQQVVPLRQLKRDIAASTLPGFAWISPNICHDMHDCSIAIGDRFLRTWVPRILPQLGTDGIVIVLFDEGTTSSGCCDQQASGGHIAAIVTGPGAGQGVVVSTRANQYSILGLIERAWGLDLLALVADAPELTGWQA